MLINISYYLLIGVLWALLNERLIETNGHRIRTIIFWPVTLTAWIIGFIQAMKNNNNEEM